MGICTKDKEYRSSLLLHVLRPFCNFRRNLLRPSVTVWIEWRTTFTKLYLLSLDIFQNEKGSICQPCPHNSAVQHWKERRRLQSMLGDSGPSFFPFPRIDAFVLPQPGQREDFRRLILWSKSSLKLDGHVCPPSTLCFRHLWHIHQPCFETMYG